MVNGFDTVRLLYSIWVYYLMFMFFLIGRNQLWWVKHCSNNKLQHRFPYQRNIYLFTCKSKFIFLTCWLNFRCSSICFDSHDFEHNTEFSLYLPLNYWIRFVGLLVWHTSVFQMTGMQYIHFHLHAFLSDLNRCK